MDNLLLLLGCPLAIGLGDDWEDGLGALLLFLLLSDVAFYHLLNLWWEDLLDSEIGDLLFDSVFK